MKTALILAGAITIVLMSMEGPASASSAPPKKALEVLEDVKALNKALDEGLARYKRNIIDDWVGTIKNFGQKLSDDAMAWVNSYSG